MDGDTVSRVSQADEEDMRSDVSLASGTSYIRQDGILSRLDEGFQESKSDLIQRFLLDQAELNRRFEEIAEDEHANGQSSRDDSRDTLEETEKMLRRKLNVHGRTLGYQRSRTSMGFHNQAEFLRDNQADSSSGSSDSEDAASDYSTNSVKQHVPDVRYAPREVSTRPRVPPIVLQPILRPKTSVGRRRASQPEVAPTESGYSYQTVPHPRFSHFDHKSVALHQSYPSSGSSHIDSENRNFVPSGSINVGMSRNRNNVRPSESNAHPSVSKMLTVSYKKRQDNGVSGQASNSFNIDCSKNIVKQRRKVHQKNTIQPKDVGRRNIELNMATVNGRRSSLVKLPPLDRTVSQTPSQKPLNFPCY